MEKTEQVLYGWWQHFDYCFNYNPSAQICESFWTNAIGSFIGIGVVMVAFGAWKIFDYRRKLRRAEIAEWERNSVDEAGIREQMWVGEDARAIDTPDDEMLAQIKAGIEQRKKEVSAASTSVQ